MIYSKLKTIRELLGLNQSDASLKSGIAQKDISLLESGKKKFIPQEYILFLYNSGVDLNTLYDDELEISLDKKDNTPQRNNIKLGNNVVNTTSIPTQKGGSTVHPTVHPSVHPSLNFGLPKVVTVDLNHMNTISLVGVRARAGYLGGYGDPVFVEKLPSYNLPGFHNGTYRAFEVDGDSMKPTLGKGDIVVCEWVESTDHVREDRVHVIVTKNDGIVIKRVLNRINKYGHLVCKSDNFDKMEYDNIHIYPDDILEIWYPRLYISASFKSPGEMFKRINDLEAGLSFLMEERRKEARLNKN